MADMNNDSKLTLHEAKDGTPEVAANFQKFDAKNRGCVTAEQIKAVADQ